MKLDLDLTKDELTILVYLLSITEHEGDPLKDTYELGDEEPKDPYAALKSMSAKVYRAATVAKETAT